MTDYASFLRSKRLVCAPVGISDPVELHPSLFPFQADVVRWALRRGRAALFEECGLGKSRQALEWARVVADHTGKPVLVLTPLAVAAQFVREGAAINIDVKHCREASDLTDGINVTNYERLDRFDPALFGGVVLDESSILKAHDSKTRAALIEAFQQTPFRLACTATPAPNDHVELGNHAEFLGVMTQTEMLSMFFVHDGGETQKWRLKGHAERDFWRWVCSWAVCISKPGDLGYSNEGYDLPALTLHEHVINVDDTMARSAGMLFAFEAKTLAEQRAARKGSLAARVARCAEIVNDTGEQFLVWCDLNDESKALVKSIPGAIEITGSDSDTYKEDAISAFIGEMCECSFLKKHAKRNSEQRSALPISDGATLTESTLGSAPDPNPTNATQRDEPPTLATKPPASPPGSKSVTGSKRTRKSDLPNASRSSESRPQNITLSSKDRAEAVRSVEGQKARMSPSEALPGSVDSTSIIATRQVVSEGSSAPAATLGSASSETPLSGSSGRPCTCGGRPIRVIVTKGSIFGFGVNLQNCANAAFVGLSHSFEAWHQANRRIWRFGQKREVNSHLITSSAERGVVANINRKRSDFERMISGMVEHMAELTRVELGATQRDFTDYKPATEMVIPAWLKESAA